jgi:hypothetical protein
VCFYRGGRYVERNADFESLLLESKVQATGAREQAYNYWQLRLSGSKRELPLRAQRAG